MIKPTRENLANAYAILGLPVGSSFAEAMFEYRFLAATFHPDRAFSESVKEKTAEKLKELNVAKEIIDEHFNGPEAKHKETATCICMPRKASQAEANKEPLTEPVKDNSADGNDKESIARARTRRRRAANQAFESDVPNKETAPAATPVDVFTRLKQIFENDVTIKAFFDDESVRWKGAASVVVILIGLWIFSQASQAIVSPMRQGKVNSDGTRQYDIFRRPGDPHYGEPEK